MTTVTISEDTHRKLKKLKNKESASSFNELLNRIADKELDVPSSEEMFGSMEIEDRERISETTTTELTGMTEYLLDTWPGKSSVSAARKARGFTGNLRKRNAILRSSLWPRCQITMNPVICNQITPRAK